VSSLPPFQRFLDEHRADVWRFLVAGVGAAEAEDCFQETFLAALRAYPRVRPDSNLRAWVLTIAHRKVLDAHRARGRRPLPVPDIAERQGAQAPGPGPDGAGPGPDGPWPGPDGELWAAVGSLPPKQRAAVLLRCAGDLSHSQVSAALGCSEEAARRSFHEGLKRLREVYVT
jgi:DNA-directed RNA polymerase specialized sigma24 family protein